MKKVSFIFMVLFSLYVVSGAGVIVSVTDGRIYDVDGNTVSGASVVAKDSQCSDLECMASTTSQSDGYYLVGNYKFFSSVIIEAVKGNEKGRVVAYPDSFNNIHADVVICASPSNPVLNEIINNNLSHDSVTSFSWDSGEDPNGKSKYDEFRLNGNVELALSTTVSKNLGIGEHEWAVRTCNDDCCGDWTKSSFSIGNSAPSAPIGSYSNEGGLVLFDWVSGEDSDGDSTYDEFQIAGEEKISPATPKISAVSDVFVQGKVRTCDNFGACSNWTEINSVSCEQISSSCPSAESVNSIVRNSHSALRTEVKKTKVLCNGVEAEDGFVTQIDLRSGEGIVRLQGENFSMSNLDVCPWCYDGVKNGDESGIDCGGSCGDCEKSIISSIPVKNRRWIFGILVHVVLIFSVLYDYRRGRGRHLRN